MFDEIIIRQDRNLRGKDENDLIDEIHNGIKSVNPNKKVDIIRSEKDAIIHAIKNAEKDSLVIVSSDVVPDALNLVMKLREKERTAV